MKRLFSLFLILAFCLPCALAQSTADDTPATKEDVEKLFATLHLRDQMRQVMDLSMKQSSQAARDALKKKIPDLTQKDMDRIDAMMDRVMKSVDMNGMLDDMIPVYQRHLSKVDVAAMEAFYENPYRSENVKRTTGDDGGSNEGRSATGRKNDGLDHGRGGKGGQRGCRGIEAGQRHQAIARKL